MFQTSKSFSKFINNYDRGIFEKSVMMKIQKYNSQILNMDNFGANEWNKMKLGELSATVNYTIKL